MEGERINKYLASHGFGSRRTIDTMIEKGRVTLNGTKAGLGARITEKDEVAIDGKPVQGSTSKDIIRVTYLLNKPIGVVSTASDEQGRETVVDLLPKEFRLFPVGRLDMMTTGAILLTNDGDLANKLMHPRYHVEKVYEVVLDKPLTREDCATLEHGVLLDGVKTAPCTIAVDHGIPTHVSIVLKEGKNRQIHRMFGNAGYRVQTLSRISYGGITLKGLAPGQWRALSDTELNNLVSISQHAKHYEKADTPN